VIGGVSMGMLEKLLGQVSIVSGACAEPDADQAPIAGMRIANNSGEALLCSPARGRFAIATRINRFMFCPPSDEGDAWVATDWCRSAAAEFTDDASDSHRANCRHWCVGGTLVPVQPHASFDRQSGVPPKPGLCEDRTCPATPAPLEFQQRVACDAVKDKPIAPADKRMDPEHDPEKWVPVFGKDHAPPKSSKSSHPSQDGKKAPAAEPATRALAPTRRGRATIISLGEPTANHAMRIDARKFNAS
jgi:hypothetical protein